MTEQQMTIGKLATAAQCKPETIRYYEKIGLLPKPVRSIAGYRLYGACHQRQLSFIRKGRNLGFSLESIREMLSLLDDLESSCEEISRLSRQHLLVIETKVQQLRAISAQLNQLISQCPDEKISGCRIVNALMSDESTANTLYSE
jgi:DNA-binding transcriptional MerR regulator